MRILLILLMCVSFAYGQNDTTKYFKSYDYGWSWQRGKFKMLVLPTDTTNNKLGVAQLSNGLYYGNGTKWQSVGGVDTSFLSRYYRKNQVDSAIAASAPIYDLQDITDNGYSTTDSIIAASFKRTGGTSSQFLKANGSVDNNAYLTSAVTSIATAAPILGGTITSGGTISADTGRGLNQLATSGSLTKVKDSLATLINTKQSTISLTTTGTSGASTFGSNILNIPTYSLSGLGGVDSIRLVNTGILHTTPATFSKVGTTGVITQTLATQTAYSYFGTGATSSTPTFRTTLVLNKDSTPTTTGKQFTLVLDSTDNTVKKQRFVQIDSTERTYTDSIIYTGGTRPSGTKNHTYQWSQTGRAVTFRINILFGTAGSGNTKAVLPFPSVMPIPTTVTGFTLSNSSRMIPVLCNGGTTTTIVNQISAAIIFNAGTPAISVDVVAQNLQVIQVSGRYFTNN